MMHDTIAAISTALGESGIAVIRVSGPDAIEEVSRIFKSNKDLREADTHTVHYGYIVHPDSGERVEEVLVSIMRAPRSFTKENVVEISCHGGIIAVNKVMELLLAQNIRLAEPGEFTKRAFLNGRIDLSQAEAVIDLIRSKSDQAFSMALKQVQGELSNKINRLRQQLIELLAHIEVNIDYPEHDVESMTSSMIRNVCGEVAREIEKLLMTAKEGKILREGIATAIVGRPNVGKSSLLNALARDNKAIVTDIPGTTRDVIEEYVTVNGIPIRLMDTAGLRETTDVVEQIGVERSRHALEEADLILLVLNNSEPLSPEETELLDKIQERQSIVIINKIDLPQRLDLSPIRERFPDERVVRMSVKDGVGVDELGNAISRLFFSGQIESRDMTYVSNVRHIGLLRQALQFLRDADRAAEEGIPIDIIQIDVRSAWESLGEIIGDAVGESLIDQIFSQFCLGK
jgi:tRNA modification GTPase